MYEVRRLSYEDLSDDDRRFAVDNGRGREFASYLRITHPSIGSVIRSDAMDPEAATFFRDLMWIKDELDAAYRLGVIDGMARR